jgi:hypothetical protein
MSDRRDVTRAEEVARRRRNAACCERNGADQNSSNPADRARLLHVHTCYSAPDRYLPKKPRRRLILHWACLSSICINRNFPCRACRSANWRFASSSFSLLLGLAIYLAFTLPYFYVPGATVLGNNHIAKRRD